ncbi:MAG: DEAD/DEAH box helicase [SAR324 cluster bacterium]|nr:DEAD/DEAH box helicase [SAR324 cluster bacterium]
MSEIKIHPKLQKIYSTLTILEQELLELLSIIYEAPQKHILLQIIIVAKLQSGTPLNENSLTLILKQFIKKGLINAKFECNPDYVEELTSIACQKESFINILWAIRRHMSITYFDKSLERHISVFRSELYAGNINSAISKMHTIENDFGHKLNKPVLEYLCGKRTLSDWMDLLPNQVSLHLSFYQADYLLMTMNSQVLPFMVRIEQRLNQLKEEEQGVYRQLLVILYLLRGNWEKADTLIKQEKFSPFHGVRGLIKFLKDDNSGALTEFESALAYLKKVTGKKKLVLLDPFLGVFYVLALLKNRNIQNVSVAENYLDAALKQESPQFQGAHSALKALVFSLKNQISHTNYWLNRAHSHLNSSISMLVTALVTAWIDPDKLPKMLTFLNRWKNEAERFGFEWFSMEYSVLLNEVEPSDRHFKEGTERLDHKLKLKSLIHNIPKVEYWKIMLDALSQMSEQSTKASVDKQERLIWSFTLSKRPVYYVGNVPAKDEPLNLLEDHSLEVAPKLQSILKSGVWSRSKIVTVKQLREDDNLKSLLTAQDEQILSVVEVLKNTYPHSDNYPEVVSRVLNSLAGHPLIFQGNTGILLEVILDEPELWVEQVGKEFNLRFSIDIGKFNNARVILIKETASRFKVIQIKQEHQRLAGLFNNKPIRIPAQAQEQLSRAVAGLSSMIRVHSSLEGHLEGVETVDGDSRCHVNLNPYGSGLRVNLMVKPFPLGSLLIKAGKGGEHVITEIEGKRIQAKRSLSGEEANVAKVLKSCEVLNYFPEQDREWLIDDPEACLELLLQLDDIKDHVVLEWPEGEKFAIRHRTSLKHVHMTIKHQNDWFGISGNIQVDDQLVMDLKELLTLAQSHSGKFIPLGDGEFMALTESFRKRLDDMLAFGDNTKDGLKFHKLTTMALPDLTDEVGAVEGERAWSSQLSRLEKARKIQPEVPPTLQAELREYQLEGFEWLARLANWGVGACLADDMGLGKTLQALTIMLDRATEGPSLVVAPTSVCLNWIDEATRFAPTLRPVIWGGKDRESLISDIGPFDMLICSYTLLQQDIALLEPVKFRTIVLDEGQAIKNRDTKRSQAAMSLQGEFKIITTGTPLENHLGELWNLFQFINPGLLGSMEKYNQRYAYPIERDQDNNARQRLRKLIQPFILRRIKSQVLQELPPKTEIVLHVELTREERAMYEALRQKTIESLANFKGPEGARHLQILAEIMKLRRICCHPRLILPEMPLAASKLELFGEVVTELRENKHKALVFSQFVDHLSIIREYLDQHKFSYCYLDGSTPQKKRQEEINRFQTGKTDLFLISLKAGGTGLNLTAADYVIHMDPWWNPAVEDQASDRAHRIGQTRPVTIYRLVTRETIEEKIVTLHQHKRELANSLLDGTEMSGRFISDELLKLIREN